MKKLLRIIRHEWRLLMAERTAPIVIGLFVAAIALGLWGGQRWVGFQQATLVRLRGEERARYDALREQARVVEAKFGAANQTSAENWDPRHPYYIGNTKGARYAWLPPAPLAVTAIGQSDVNPYYFKVSTDLKQNFTSTYELENPLKLLLGRFDLAFVLIWLYPLLILALSFNLLAAERENGTLALLLSQPVSLGVVVRGKIIVRALIAIVPVLLCATLGMWLAGAAPFSAESLPRYALWMLAVLLYGAFWLALAALVNARGKSAAANALLLAGVWLLCVVLLPSGINALASLLYPAPSRVAYVQALREAAASEAGERSKLLSAFYEDHPELAQGKLTRRDEFTLTKERLNQRTETLLRPLNEQFAAQLQRQQAFVNRFRFLSPTLLMQQMLSDVAGTGQARYDDFLRQVDDYHQAWRATLNPLVARREILPVAAFDNLPRYQYCEEATDKIVRRLLAPIVSLGALTLLLSFVGLAAYGRFCV
jgi:ABC-2 type transport system permease protein